MGLLIDQFEKAQEFAMTMAPACESQGARLHETEVMGVRRLPAAQEARL
jgi:hypothetical protein